MSSQTSTQGEKPMKYVLITGGVLSGIGKGVVASSTGMLLRNLGLHVTSIKIDPYLNIGKFSSDFNVVIFQVHC